MGNILYEQNFTLKIKAFQMVKTGLKDFAKNHDVF